jgi:hypothetical protein
MPLHMLFDVRPARERQLVNVPWWATVVLQPVSGGKVAGRTSRWLEARVPLSRYIVDRHDTHTHTSRRGVPSRTPLGSELTIPGSAMPQHIVGVRVSSVLGVHVVVASQEITFRVSRGPSWGGQTAITDVRIKTCRS